MKINPDRLWRNLEELGEIGRVEGQGLNRLALNDADLEARDWFRTRLTGIGLEVRTDAAANIIGKLPAAAEVSEPKTVIIGSHLDTVPNGGRFDGALGVLAGLECARTLCANNVALPWNLEVIDFTDEEGHHFAGTFGSRAMMGLVEPAELDSRKVEGVPTMAEDLRKAGLDPERLDAARREPAAIEAYLELHVEQGGKLEAQQLDVAAVTGIVGIYRYVVEVLGEANHAGTTPMGQRRDALVAASPVFGLAPEWARARSPEMVATIGQVVVEPGAVNVIPGLCRFSVELRSLHSEDMARLRDCLMGWLKANVDFKLSAVLEKDGVELAKRLVDRIVKAAETEGYRALSMPSGAGHDAQSFAPFVPTGMIFVPSRGGLSHCPEEYSEPEWVARGAQTLLRTVLELAETPMNR